MAHTRNWVDTAPVDHTLNKNWPGEDMKVRVDVDERLTAQQYGFASGETEDGIKRLEFREQAADPGAGSDVIRVYGKAVSTKTELFAEDEDGNVIQITTGGKLNAASMGGVYAAANVAALATMMNLIYPVGSFYFNDAVSTNPGTLLGIGTWVAVEEEVIVGYKSGSSEFGSIGSVAAGEKAHTLITSEMPAHTHEDTNKHGGGSDNSSQLWNSGIGSGKTTTSTGGDGSHNNIQPGYCAYTWRRTA